jgi:hypothetical protein
MHEIVGGDSGSQDLHPNLAGPRFRQVLFHHLQHLRPAVLPHDDALKLRAR